MMKIPEDFSMTFLSSFASYFLAILVIIFSGLIVKKITKDDSVPSYFIMELPEYKWPSIKRATISMLSRAKAFIIKAGTIILVCNAIVQILQTFNWQLQVIGENAADTSILASIASPVAIILAPLFLHQL
jgi:ferrous iron transport protein B